MRQILTIVLIVGFFFGVIRVARLNYRQGRGDREGALRLACVMFALEILLWLCRGHLVPSIDTLGVFIIAVSTALFVSGTTWMLYLALEPWVRRRWPQTIISWSRLLSGQFRDPLVGRDILFGVMLGVMWILIFQFRYIPMMHMGAAPGIAQTEYVAGGREALGAWLMQIPASILGTLGFFFLLLGLKLLLRKDWLAAIAFVAVYALPQGLTSSYVAVELPVADFGLRHRCADRVPLRTDTAGLRDLYHQYAGQCPVHRRSLGVVHANLRSGAAQRGGAGGLGLLSFAGWRAIVETGDRVAVVSGQPFGSCAESGSQKSYLSTKFLALLILRRADLWRQ